MFSVDSEFFALLSAVRRGGDVGSARVKSLAELVKERAGGEPDGRRPLVRMVRERLHTKARGVILHTPEGEVFL